MISDNKVTVKISVLNGKIKEAQDSNGLADGFVRIGKVHTEKDKIKWFLKTPVQSKTLSPVWNYELEDVKLNLFKYKSLKVEMYDRDLFSDNDFIGQGDIYIQDINKRDSTDTISLFSKDGSKMTGNVWVLVQKQK